MRGRGGYGDDNYGDDNYGDGGYGDDNYGGGYEQRPDRSGWSACADEGDFCDFSGRRVVRYGARGRFADGVFRNGVQCDNDSFGDPAPGKHKRCYVRQ